MIKLKNSQLHWCNMPKKDLKCFENLITLIRELRNRLSFYMPFSVGTKEQKYLAEGISVESNHQ
nr:MAG TPA: hypothetical protein [Caudoviricetes sp.]